MVAIAASSPSPSSSSSWRWTWTLTWRATWTGTSRVDERIYGCGLDITAAPTRLLHVPTNVTQP
jgi:hypothetical protein